MSKIDKLGIRGIRSFGPFSIESVSFNTPLTLIVGENGCGKTTIIECLKHATTGEHPPNTKGGAFLHDPKLCGEKEVKAQVKLSFYSTIGQRHVVTRNMQVTMSKKKMAFKTVDGTLQIINGSEKITLSKKNADLDQMIPEKLGVPAAILESVIFCHQDDSLWPLSEPAVLKKKFDELFEATKYTKAIDELRKLRRDQGELLRKHKYDEEQCKIDKDRGEKAERALSTLSDEIEDLKRQYTSLVEEQKVVGQQEKQKREQANSFLGIVTELKNKNDLYASRKQMADELHESTEIMNLSDEELRADLAQYGDRVKQMEKEAEAKKRDYAELQQEVTASRKSLQEKHGELGKHQSDKDHYERQLRTRAEMIREAAQRHEIRGYDGDLTDPQVRAFEARIQKLLEDKKREAARLSAAREKEKDALDRQISDLTTRKHSLMNTRSSAQERLNDIATKSAKLQRDMDALHVDEGAQAVLQSNYTQLEGRLRKENEDLKAAGLETQIADEDDRLKQLDLEGEKLNGEMVLCTRMATDRAQLDVRKNELSERRLHLKALTDSWSGKLSALVDGPFNLDTIGDDYQIVLERHEADVSAKKKLVEAAQQEMKQLDFKLSTCRDEEKKVSTELGRCERVVLEAMTKAKDEDDSEPQIEKYLRRLVRCEEDLIQAEKDISLFDELIEYYKDAEVKATKNNKCLMCDRPFGDGEGHAKSKLLRKIAKNLDPQEKQDLIEDENKLRKNLDVLKPARASYEAHQRAEARAPAVESEIKALESQKESIVRRLEMHDAALREADENRYDVESLGKTVRSITEFLAQIAESERQIGRLASQQGSSGVVRSAEEIQDLQAACSERSRAVKAKITKLSTDLQRRKDVISQLELDKSELKHKLSTLETQVQRKHDLGGQIQSLKEDRAKLQGAKDQADRDMEELEPQISKAKGVREEQVERAREKVQKAEHDRDFIATTAHKIKSISNELQEYLDRGGPDQLARTERAIKNLEDAAEGTEKEIASLTADINKLRDEMQRSDRKKKNIQDNLQYNRTMRDLDSLQNEIESLERRNASEDWEKLDEECRALKQHFDTLSGESSSIMGQIKSKDKELGKQLEDYETNYMDARAKFRRAHIEVETTKAAIEDLASYISALEKAIIAYHGRKMEEVNRIAGELWRSTYQGTDIDTILIRSEAEGAGGGSSGAVANTASATRRNYNYRLCMVKQDTEMDMRGRCSAGQKVLASIIIRLALAESFGVNCGLIALDEPTTNLDEANIRSLAMSLHNIIQARQAQANFQLIVITHDEAFLRAMQCSDFCDTFYRVKRDEKQRSTIMRENISSLMD